MTLSYSCTGDPRWHCEVVTQSRPRLLEALELIERRTMPNPWSAQSLEECFDEAYKVIVLFRHELSCGFAVIYNTKVTTDLLSLSVDPEYQGLGLGSFLLECALREALRGEALECFLEVRVSNLKAHALYERFGFLQVGLRKGYYTPLAGRPAEDAYTLRLADIEKALAARKPLAVPADSPVP
ncbi:MAG: ribosomal protein S18-alanine N-acetyltransferase [Succinivibrio sp.]|nr:ribosomal protein S18-alanine N-acetyltransferase [Succinivibrio sp.]